MKRLVILFLWMAVATVISARNVTISVSDRPAPEVFREIMTQTGKNFVYESDLLAEMKISVSVKNKSLKKTLKKIFEGTDIDFKIKGGNVLLKRRVPRRVVTPPMPSDKPQFATTLTPHDAEILNEVVVISRLGSPAVASAEMGATKLTSGDVLTTPVLFGEADIIKSLHTLPGVAEGNEGLAGMMVHGGGPDENLYLLDNVPLYQVNHLAGLFSAFNVDAVKHLDFFKTSIPAKYDGRLSSVVDVRTADGDTTGHHGSGKIGLTSGAFNISGPIGSRTTYMAAIRRSWFDVLTIPLFAMVNAASTDEKTTFGYNFTDLNAKVRHRFNNRTTGSLGIYYGEDYLKARDKSTGIADYSADYEDRNDYRWGNILVRAGVVHSFSPKLNAEFTAAYTRYFGKMKVDNREQEKARDSVLVDSRTIYNTANHIDDYIGRADFDWRPDRHSTVRFGASYTYHSFLPSRSSQTSIYNGTTAKASDDGKSYGGSEFNAYIEDDWKVSDRFRMNVGLHTSLFSINHKTRGGISPRISANWRFTDRLSFKAAYTRTVQYVHHLSRSYLSLPTDHWVPVIGDLKPQTADKIGAGLYWQSPDGQFTASIEGYLKKMNNLVEYLDEYYLMSPLDQWNSRLTSGRGTSKGIDFMVSRTFGKVTGHIAYSLSHTDRTFPDKNGGKTYPARFDIPHSINILVNWQISPKVSLNANWTGHSGNRYTLMTGTWEMPDFNSYGAGTIFNPESVPLKTSINNYRLPFYHRLDLSLTVTNSRGYWNFSLYNAYNHLNAIAIRRSNRDQVTVSPSWGVEYESRPVFQKVCLLPLIPSISYTWLF